MSTEKEIATMDTLTFPKKDLLERIRTNRAEHRKIFEEALDGYHKMLIEKLDEMYNDAKANRLIDTRINLVRPTDQTKDYDRAITMLEMCNNEVITLGQVEFSNYVMDEWNWTQGFLTSNARYSQTAMAKLSK